MLKRLVYNKTLHWFFIAICGLIFLITFGFEVILGIQLGANGMFSFLVLILLAFLAIMLIIVGYGMIQIRQALKKFRETEDYSLYLDVTAENTSPPAKLQDKIQGLEALGMKPFAILDASEKQDRSLLLWYWADATYTVRAYVAIAGALRQVLTVFITIFEDDAVLQTGYQVNMQMETEDIHVSNITSSLEAAYDYHLQQRAFYEAQHGHAVAIPSSETLVEYSNRLKAKNQIAVLENRVEAHNKYLTYYGFMMLGFAMPLFITNWVSIPLSFGFIGMIMGLVMMSFMSQQAVDESGIGGTRKKKKNS